MSESLPAIPTFFTNLPPLTSWDKGNQLADRFVAIKNELKRFETAVSDTMEQYGGLLPDDLWNNTIGPQFVPFINSLHVNCENFKKAIQEGNDAELPWKYGEFPSWPSPKRNFTQLLQENVNGKVLRYSVSYDIRPEELNARKAMLEIETKAPLITFVSPDGKKARIKGGGVVSSALDEISWRIDHLEDVVKRVIQGMPWKTFQKFFFAGVCKQEQILNALTVIAQSIAEKGLSVSGTVTQELRLSS